MSILSNYMTRLNDFLLHRWIGEGFSFGFAASSGILGVLEYLTPILAFLGALLSVIAGIYTVRLKRAGLKQNKIRP